jgi:hypothetical protein
MGGQGLEAMPPRPMGLETSLSRLLRASSVMAPSLASPVVLAPPTLLRAFLSSVSSDRRHSSFPERCLTWAFRVSPNVAICLTLPSTAGPVDNSIYKAGLSLHAAFHTCLGNYLLDNSCASVCRLRSAIDSSTPVTVSCNVTFVKSRAGFGLDPPHLTRSSIASDDFLTMLVTAK